MKLTFLKGKEKAWLQTTKPADKKCVFIFLLWAMLDLEVIHIVRTKGEGSPQSVHSLNSTIFLYKMRPEGEG